MNAAEHRLVMSSNRVEIQAAGKVVGMVQLMQPSDDYGHEPVSGVGDIHVQEHVPTLAQHTISITQACLFEDNLRDMGIAMENGDDALKGIVFDICIYSKDPKMPGLLRKYTKCSYVSGDLDITKNGVMISRAQYRALNVTGRKL